MNSRFYSDQTLQIEAFNSGYVLRIIAACPAATAHLGGTPQTRHVRREIMYDHVMWYVASCML